MKNESFIPNTILGKYIDRYYIFEKNYNEQPKAPTILPGTGLELIFYLTTPLSLNGKKLPKAHIICPRQIIELDKTNKIHFISIRFKSGRFRHFTSIDFKQLNNNFISTYDLWKNDSKLLIKKIYNANSINHKLEIIDSFLTTCLKKHLKKKSEEMDKILDFLYYNFNAISIKELSLKYNLSERQLERSFKTHYGISPKKFQVLSRFQNIVKTNLLERNKNYIHSLFDNGYFDQSHFIKEFKKLTNQTPLEYFKIENFDNHFYHKSLK